MTATSLAGNDPSPAPTAGFDRWSAASDRLNPILVREVMQAVKGRAFLLTILGALLVTVVIATGVVQDGDSGARSGKDAFSAGLATLAPLLLFVVPNGAYHSMRTELRAGIVEQLLLSRLRPTSIVLGKLFAAMVQFVLYVSVLAPLLATSYLLRGVDLPTIGLSLVFALALCVGATASAISAAAQGMLPALQSLTNVAMSLALGLGTFVVAIYVGTGEYLRDLGWLLRSTEFGMVVSLVIGGALLGTVLSILTAQSFLMHAYENRSTQFRVFLFAVVALTFGWLWAFVDPANRAEAVWGIVSFLTLLGAVFGLFMVTEQRDLSPRLAAHVPSSRLAALAAAPFLPGRDRGMLAFLIHVAVLLAIAGACSTLSVPRSLTQMPFAIAAYALFWLGVARLLRGRLPSVTGANNVTRLLLPFTMLLAILLPLLFDVFAFGGVTAWHPGHVLNPFWTIDEIVFRHRFANERAVLVTAIVALAVLQLPAVMRGVREVLTASAARAKGARG